MTYDFTSLYDADFEDLVRDLIGRELGVRFEAFTRGPDNGIDGRHALGPTKTILQAKHYAGSRLSQLLSTMSKERASIEKLASSRYILATSTKLSPSGKAKLALRIGQSLNSEDDIFGPDDLNLLLRKYRDIEKSHLKLWLSSTVVLEQVLRSGTRQFSLMTREEIDESVSVYAPNPSFNDASNVLSEHHVLIIAGPPGVGKTTLANMLSFAHIAEGWEFVAVRDISHAFEELGETRPQLLYFDDFLGSVDLDRQALSRMDSQLARLISKVSRSKNTRFILTTRAPILEEAKTHSEHLSSRRIDISRYLLDVGIYTRQIRARILYNHLLTTNTPQIHIDALIESGALPNIVDHKNYNPRLISQMTGVEHLIDVEPENYADTFIDTLNNPIRLWDLPFRKHLPRKCQHLLIALFFSNQYGVNVDLLRVNFEGFHEVFSAHFGLIREAKDFEEALRIVEGGFVRISGRSITFVNPSVRDYLTSYLKDLTLVTLSLKSARRAEVLKAIWEQAKGLNRELRRSAAANCVPLADTLLKWPTTKKTKSEWGYYYDARDDLANSDRIRLLLEWWFETGDQTFSQRLMTLASAPVAGWDEYSDGPDLLKLAANLRDPDYGPVPCAIQLAEIFESAVGEMLRDRRLNMEMLDRISDAEDDWGDKLGEQIRQRVKESVVAKITNMEQEIEDMKSESELDDQRFFVERLGKRYSLSDDQIRNAVSQIEDRLHSIEERSQSTNSSLPKIHAENSGSFDDTALSNLFAPLYRRNQLK